MDLLRRHFCLGDETMSPNELDSQSYWEHRLAANLNLRGTGHRAFDLEYNRWLYQAQLDCFEFLIEQHGVKLEGQRVLDIGCGTGFYIELFQRKGASAIHGVDISETSTRYLEKSFLTGHFATYDVSDADFPFEGQFDLISAISVLYHITDDTRFDMALDNICQRLKSGGHLFLSDTFRKPLLPTARHAVLRPLPSYQSTFERHGVRVLDLLPIYYSLNRTYVPLIGPRVMSVFKIGRWLYKLDTRLRESGSRVGEGMKLLLAKKE